MTYGGREQKVRRFPLENKSRVPVKGSFSEQGHPRKDSPPPSRELFRTRVTHTQGSLKIQKTLTTKVTLMKL